MCPVVDTESGGPTRCLAGPVRPPPGDGLLSPLTCRHWRGGGCSLGGAPGTWGVLCVASQATGSLDSAWPSCPHLQGDIVISASCTSLSLRGWAHRPDCDPVPCSLDLDAWINEPPSDSESEGEKPKAIFPDEERRLAQQRQPDVDEEELARVRLLCPAPPSMAHCLPSASPSVQHAGSLGEHRGAERPQPSTPRSSLSEAGAPPAPPALTACPPHPAGPSGSRAWPLSGLPLELSSLGQLAPPLSSSSRPWGCQPLLPVPTPLWVPTGESQGIQLHLGREWEVACMVADMHFESCPHSVEKLESRSRLTTPSTSRAPRPPRR